MPRLRKILKGLGVTALVLVALLIVAVIGGVSWVNSHSGGEKIRREILTAVNGSLAGKLAIDRLDLKLGGRIVVEGVSLYDPEGNLVARIRRLEGNVAVRELLKKKIDVSDLTAFDPELHLAVGAKGLNLARALDARVKKEATPSTPLAWEVLARKVLLEGLRVDLVVAPGEPPLFDLRELKVAASGTFGSKGTSLDLTAAGKMASPEDAPITLAAKLEGGSAADPISPLTFTLLDLDMGPTRLKAKGLLTGKDLGIEIESLRMGARDLKAFLPTSPVIADVTGRGALQFDGKALKAQLELGVGEKGKAAVNGVVETAATPVALAADVTMSGIDLAQIIEKAPSTELNGTAEVHFEVGLPAPGKAHLELKLAPSRFLDAAVTSLLAQADSSGTEAHVRAFELRVPGALLTGSGLISPEALDLTASAEVPSIKDLSANLARMGKAEPPPLMGKARLTVSVKGTPRAPRVQARGNVGQLVTGSVDIADANLTVSLPDATNPYVFEAHVLARKATVGDVTLDKVELKGDANGRTYRVDVASEGLTGVSAHAGGVLDGDRQGTEVQELLLSFGDARWTLERAVHVSFRDGVSAETAHLVSGEQRLEVRGGLKKNRLDLDARAVKIDLARLPPLVVPKSLALAGKIDLEGKLGGDPKKPEGHAKVTARGFGAGEYRDIDLDGEVTLKALRFSGTASVVRRGATVTSTFDLPFKLLDAPAGTAVSATVQAKDVSVPMLAELLKLPELKAGTVSLDATLSGTSDRPSLKAQVSGSKLRYAKYMEVDLGLVADSAESTTAELTLVTAGGQVVLHAKAPLALLEMVRHPPDARALQALQLEASLDTTRLDLKKLAGKDPVPPNVEGLVTVKATFKGSAQKPRGQAHVEFGDGVFPPWKQVQVVADARATDEGMELTGELSEEGKRWLGAVAALRLPVERLRTLDDLGRAPVTAHLVGGPAELSKLTGVDASVVEAVLSADLNVSGTLAEPVVKGTVQATDLKASDQKLGKIESTIAYAASKAETKTVVTPLTGGAANIDANLKLGLGLMDLKKGVDFMNAPLGLTLRTADLDLKVLNLLPRLFRQGGGSLQADVAVKGTPTLPVPRGQLVVKDGQVAVAGYGSYRNIGIDLRVADQEIALKQLSVRAGDGLLEVSGKATRASPREPYAVTMALKAKDFPLTIGDQPTATVSAETESWSGQIQGNRANITLHLRELRLALPEVQPKDLQKLDANPDIILVSSRKTPKVASPNASASAPFDLQMKIIAARNVWVDSKDAKIEAGMDLDLHVVGTNVELAGEIDTKRGRVDVFSRKFEVQRGRVIFTGGPLNNPRLDVKAEHVNSREAVTVWVRVEGQVQKPKITLTSEPSLDESEIVTLLVTGRRELKRGSGATASGGGAASSIIGAVAADKFRKFFATKLPLDVLSVDVGDEGLKAAKLEAGTYLNDKTYVGYRRNFGAETERGENANEVRVEYQVAPKVTLESGYGDAGKGGADIVWTRDY